MEDAKHGALLRLFGKDLLVALPLFQLATVLIESGCQWAQVQVASRLVYMWYRLGGVDACAFGLLVSA